MGRLYNTCTTRYGMVKIKFHPAVSPMKRGNPSGKGHINIRQSFGDETLFFVSIKCRFFCGCLKIFDYICIFQKKTVILHTHSLCGSLKQ